MIAVKPNKKQLNKPKPKQPGNEVTIERDVLLRMMKDQRYINLLPPLKTLTQKQRKKAKGCGCGAKTKPNLVQSDFEAAKRQIANLLSTNPQMQKELKSLLGTQTVRLKYMKADNSGAVVRKFV